MTTITYTVSDRPVTPARLDTEQVYTLNSLTGIKMLDPKFNRTYAYSMDRRSVKGTKTSKSEELVIDFVIPMTDKLEYEELLHSITDYQIVEIDATDLNHIDRDVRATLISDDFPYTLIGAKHFRSSMRFTVIQ